MTRSVRKSNGGALKYVPETYQSNQIKKKGS